MKDCAVISGTISKWIARITQQVNKHIQILTSLDRHRTCTGPARSTPVYRKGGASLILNSGSGGGLGDGYDFPS